MKMDVENNKAKETIKILLVDDDAAFVESNRNLFEAQGYEVHAAHSGAEGFDLARKIHPHVIIMDVMMTTDTEGFDIAKKISESPALINTKVLLVTGLAKTLEDFPGGWEPDKTWLPVERVLEKPSSPERLIMEVERLLKEERRSAGEWKKADSFGG